ncbi:phage head-tail connector protein [Streptomyces sp. NPDC004237]|uniref:phage head-tail connector protein n=1 Tax=Streptomyces sp. NPDC004237 TaxID=3154455 RepID=UPI0033BE06A3
MSIVTLADTKAHLNIPADNTDDDVELQGFIDAATEPVEEQLGTVVVPRLITNQHDFGTGTTAFLLRQVPVISLTSIISLDGSQSWTVTSPAMHVDGPSGSVTVLSGPPLTGMALVTHQAGLTVIGANVRLAAKIIIQHLWETQRGVMGVRLGGDGETYVSGRGFAIPRRAIELLGEQLPGIA